MAAQYKMRVKNGQLSKVAQNKIREELERLRSISPKLKMFTILVDFGDGTSTTVEIEASDEDTLEFVAKSSAYNVMDAVTHSVESLQRQLRQRQSQFKSKVKHVKRVAAAKQNLKVLLGIAGALVVLVILVAIVRHLISGRQVVLHDKKPTFPVSGEVLLNGDPLPGATVVLRPAETAVANEVWPFGYPRGTVESNGSYRVGTYEPHDGAPVGEYEILVMRPLTPDANKGPAQSEAVIMGDSSFSTPATKEFENQQLSPETKKDPLSPVGKFTVEEKKNSIPPLELGDRT